ncbi:aspartate/glutamate racemase family protein [Rhodothermus profundi]|uniref:Aspartate racemase n=1 Tax=Rhodothermus profundi TaxID=633813 RepID=A0A1M6RVS8_9BACT|nr:amino acid racemase [Rhodothermus profundi]SHK36478.1 aspartate racemase [Rhodothermus profundi]
MKDKIIGVIGGMGPYAGLALVHHIFDQTLAASDQEHLPVVLFSMGDRVPDRSAFLFGKTPENPGRAIAEQIRLAESVGAVVVGIPCNTAHAPPIFQVIQETLARAGSRVRLLHLIDETVRFLREHYPDVRRVGVLSTLATYRLGLYHQALEAAGYEAVMADESVQETIVNRAIFDASYGIKAQSHPVSKIARQSVLTAIEHLRQKNVEAVVLGCTELPLAIPEMELDGLPIIDPSLALARALIRETYPEQLKPL